MMNAVAPAPLVQNTRRYRNYQLDLLPKQCILTIDDHMRSVILLCQDRHGFINVTELQVFTDVEYALLRLLLQYASEYVPYADLLACQSGDALEQCQWVVNQALDRGDIKEVLKSVRCHVARMRGKMQCFGLDIAAEIGYGYVIIAAQH